MANISALQNKWVPLLGQLRWKPFFALSQVWRGKRRWTRGEKKRSKIGMKMHISHTDTIRLFGPDTDWLLVIPMTLAIRNSHSQLIENKRIYIYNICMYIYIFSEVRRASLKRDANWNADIKTAINIYLNWHTFRWSFFFFYSHLFHFDDVHVFFFGFILLLLWSVISGTTEAMLHYYCYQFDHLPYDRY